MSKEGQEEAEREMQEVQMMLGATVEAVSGTLAAEGGVPAPRAPQVDGQSSELPETPVLATCAPWRREARQDLSQWRFPHCRGRRTGALKRIEL